MSMYNLVCGGNPLSATLIEMLGIPLDDIPRFRDCFVTEDCIVIYTRTGGGNRDAYTVENAKLQSHPLFVRDEDDNMDETYANFFFSFPEAHSEVLTQLYESKLIDTPTEKWEATFAALGAVVPK